jgi:hypothetical protein
MIPPYDNLMAHHHNPNYDLPVRPELVEGSFSKLFAKYRTVKTIQPTKLLIHMKQGLVLGTVSYK